MPRFDPKDLAAWTGGSWDPAPPDRIEGVRHDTRGLARGDLYIALRGARFDGHDFVRQAFAAGASAAAVAGTRAAGIRTAMGGAPVPLLLVQDPAAALRDMAAGYRRTAGAKLVGVTGSAGKSTVKELIAAALSAAMPTARTLGNWNNDIGLPLSLLAMESDCRAGVFEVGTNHPGEIAALCRVLRPDWGVVTNVGPVHIEFFGRVEAIADEKAELLRCLPPDGGAVLLKDSPVYAQLRAAAACRTVTVALAGDADYTCARRDPQGGRLLVEERATGQRREIELGLPGEHNAVNALMAVAVARGFGVSWEDLARGIVSCASLPMRWEERSIGGVTVVNDAYNANPLSLRAALRTLAERYPDRRRVVVLAGMLELGEQAAEHHEAAGRWTAEAGAACLVAVGELGTRIADGAREAGLNGARVAICADAESAARALAERVKEGDVVLLKGSRAMRLEDVAQRLEKRLGAT